MTSFLQGVKNFIFGKGGALHQQQASTSGFEEVGQKRIRRHTQSPTNCIPVLQEAGYSCNGGVQGLGWYTATLQLDSDGDAAHAFYQEQPAGSQLQQLRGKQPGRQRCRLTGVQQGRIILADTS